MVTRGAQVVWLSKVEAGLKHKCWCSTRLAVPVSSANSVIQNSPGHCREKKCWKLVKDAFLSLLLSSSKTEFLVVEDLATSLIFLKCFTQAAHSPSKDSRNISKKICVVLYLVQLKFCYSINRLLMLVTKVQTLLTKWQFWLSAPTCPDFI